MCCLEISSAGLRFAAAVFRHISERKTRSVSFLDRLKQVKRMPTQSKDKQTAAVLPLPDKLISLKNTFLRTSPNSKPKALHMPTVSAKLLRSCQEHCSSKIRFRMLHGLPVWKANAKLPKMAMLLTIRFKTVPKPTIPFRLNRGLLNLDEQKSSCVRAKGSASIPPSAKT